MIANERKQEDTCESVLLYAEISGSCFFTSSNDFEENWRNEAFWKFWTELFNLKKRDESKIYDILYDKSDKTSDFIKIFCFVVSL